MSMIPSSSEEDTITFAEVIVETTLVASIVEGSSSNKTGVSLIKSAGESFAEILSAVDDRKSAATALVVAGRMLGEVSVGMTEDPAQFPDKLGSTLGAYGMTLVYAAHILLNS